MPKKVEAAPQPRYLTEEADRWLELYLEKKKIEAKMLALKEDLISSGRTSVKTSDNIPLSITRPGYRTSLVMDEVRRLLSQEAIDSCKRRHPFSGSVTIRKATK